MTKKFTAQIDEIIAKTEKRMLAVVRQSTQDVIDEAQTPVAKGGKMRVDTGFLRASGQISLNGMPTGPVRIENDVSEVQQWDKKITVTELSKVQLGSTIYFGWTANYARARETYDGFLESAVQNWQKIVDRNVSKVKARIK